ncbi:MAG: 6-phosphofructokinase, partial [Pirellulaceae bacterium]|nr:6-phosphofructokinase [Pirellulaceae bacterium]
MASTLSRPPKPKHSLRRVAILFAGGPAPAANAVISTAAVSFLRNGIEVIGIKHGYSSLIDYTPDEPLQEDRDYVTIDHKMLQRTRNSQGIMIGTARSNPGKHIKRVEHLDDAELAAPLRRVYDGLCSLEVDALISIGGDDTLKTANKFKLFQDRLSAEAHKIPVVHLPKTIDNDYMGIDFTFGYFTAVDTLATEIRNLLHDGEAGQAYFLCETMGRSAGWLGYGAAMAGEASLVISVEDIVGDFAQQETVSDPETGETVTRTVMDMERVITRMVKTMTVREEE